MKNILLVIPNPWVSATFQDVLGSKDHRFLRVSTVREFQMTMEILDPALPDLVAMTSDASDPVIKGVVDGWPDLHRRMVIMAMDPVVASDMVSLVPVPVLPRSNDRDSDFFKRCREILGE